MFWGSAGFIIGVILGSFVKALADRSLTNSSFWGRSYCPHCKHKLHWYDLFPILSYLILSGKCRHCKDKIATQYLLVEVILGILIGFLFLQSFSNFSATGGPAFGWQFLMFALNLIYKIFFIGVLIALFLTDLKKMLIPDRIVIPAIWITLIYLIGVSLFKVGYLYYFLSQTILGRLLLPPHNGYFVNHAMAILESTLTSIVMGIVIAGFFLALIIITRGKGMGGGDVKLGAFLGLVLGFPNALVALMAAFLSGAFISLILIFGGKKHLGQVIPFGPFLVFGSLISLFWGNQIIDWYLHFGT